MLSMRVPLRVQASEEKRPALLRGAGDLGRIDLTSGVSASVHQPWGEYVASGVPVSEPLPVGKFRNGQHRLRFSARPLRPHWLLRVRTQGPDRHIKGAPGSAHRDTESAPAVPRMRWA